MNLMTALLDEIADANTRGLCPTIEVSSAAIPGTVAFLGENVLMHPDDVTKLIAETEPLWRYSAPGAPAYPTRLGIVAGCPVKYRLT